MLETAKENMGASEWGYWMDGQAATADILSPDGKVIAHADDKRDGGSSGALLMLTLVSLIVPSILISLGVGLVFSQSGLDTDWWSSGFRAQLTWTVPFGVLIMFAVFNRFDRRWEEAGRDLGATPWHSFRMIVLPIILPSVVAIALFGLTLSSDEFARTLLTAGRDNTLPLEIFGMTTSVTTPVLYALGASTTGLSILVIALALSTILILRRRGAR